MISSYLLFRHGRRSTFLFRKVVFAGTAVVGGVGVGTAGASAALMIYQQKNNRVVVQAEPSAFTSNDASSSNSSSSSSPGAGNTGNTGSGNASDSAGSGSAGNNGYSGLSLIVPTIQATTRVIRLVNTCILMIMDYKFPNYNYYTYSLLPTTMTMTSTNTNTTDNTDDDDDDDDDDEKELYDDADNDDISNDSNITTTTSSHNQDDDEWEYWEREQELRQHAFEEAQARYSSKTDYPHITDITERVEAKKQEKLDMEHAAQLLAEAEQKLSELGTHKSRKSQIHKRAAQRLLDLCHVNRGVYIKIGQHLANLDYLIPQEYIEILSQLYDDNPMTSYNDVCSVIQEDFNGQHPNDIFDSFDKQPIASASLAQVHIAYKNGQKLAVKVQHRGLRETSRGDIFSLVTCVKFAEWMFPNEFQFGWLADEIAPNLPKELNFYNEGRNAEKANQHIQNTSDLKHRVIIPKIIWNMTSERVLTMEYEEGVKASNVEQIRYDMGNHAPQKVAQLISTLFASQVFESGHVHCDPHEGNLLIRPSKYNRHEPILVLVDHGLYKQLDDDFRRQYAQLWKSLMLADLDGIQTACSNMGIPSDDTYRLFSAILTARPFDEIVERSQSNNTAKQLLKRRQTRSDQAIIRGYAQRFLPNIIALLSVIPRQMILLLKMNDCLRHIDYILGHPTNTLLVTGRLASRAIYRYEMDQLSSSSRSRSQNNNDDKDGAARFVSSLSTVWNRWRTWWSYVSVQWRIQLSETSLWFLQRVGWIHLMRNE